MAHSQQDRARTSEEHPIDVEALQAEKDALHGRLLRALADAENARRRSDRTVEDARRFAVSEFARDLLPVADNLRRAIQAAEFTELKDGDSKLLEGVRATERLLTNVLERFGIRKISTQGARFDPTWHEAMTEADDPALTPGSISDVMEEGYTIHDRLLRPARVAVTKRRQDTAAEPMQASAEESEAAPPLDPPNQRPQPVNGSD
jgi:molecular chaperone GrpE